jgi:hypothetical protein
VAGAFVKALDALLSVGLEIAPAGNPDLSSAREDVVGKLRQMLTAEGFKRGLGAALGQLMRVNTRLFEGTIRVLGQQNQLLRAQIAALMAANAKLVAAEQPLASATTFDRQRTLDAVMAFNAGRVGQLRELREVGVPLRQIFVGLGVGVWSLAQVVARAHAGEPVPGVPPQRVVVPCRHEGGAVKKKTFAKPPVKRPEKLPAKFRGAAVVRGEGMSADKLDSFTERKAMDGFDATSDMWLVIEDKALEDLDDSVEVKGFVDKADAVLYAQARSHGNVDHRVLRVTEQVLVVATMNEL